MVAQFEFSACIFGVILSAAVLQRSEGSPIGGIYERSLVRLKYAAFRDDVLIHVRNTIQEKQDYGSY